MFCEECGVLLEKGLRFCENCGTPVPQENDEIKSAKNEITLKTVFNCEDWKEQWESFVENTENEIGIIITRLEALSSQLNCAQTDIVSLMESYCDSAQKRGVSYFLLDLDNNYISANKDYSVENIVTILTKVSEIHQPKYLFILGNEDIVGFQTWRNNSNDTDPDVTSDLPYNILDTESPWSGKKYNLDLAIRVGRIPTWTGETFSEFSTYFKNAENSAGKISSLKPFGLSASVWKDESNKEYSTISSSSVELSPTTNLHNVDEKISSNANLFLFNLHGSDKTKYWYGQSGVEYPETFSPDNISRIQSPNFIGVEACYGAMYEKNKTSQDANVLAALSNKTIALLGSSRIAYGASCPPGSCADIVVGEFLRNIAKGETAGDSHIAGLKKLCSSTMDDTDIKTLCEFSLFGDPSACIGENKNIGHGKLFSIKKNPLMSKGLHIAMPDIRTAVELSLTKVDDKILSLLNKHVYETYEELQGIQPETFQLSNSNLFQSIYKKNEKIVKIYFDKSGKIKKEISSK